MELTFLQTVAAGTLVILAAGMLGFAVVLLASKFILED